MRHSPVLSSSFFFIPVPVEAPILVKLTAQSSTSVTLYWKLSKRYYNERKLMSFKLLYQKEGSNVPQTQIIKDAKNVQIENGLLVFSSEVTGLEKFTQYEFKVCVFSSVGCGPKSSSKIARTWEDGKGLYQFLRLSIVNWGYCRELQR